METPLVRLAATSGCGVRRGTLPRLTSVAALWCLLSAVGASGQTKSSQPPPFPSQTPQIPEGRILVEVRFDGDYQRLDELAARFRAKVVRFERPHLYLTVEESQLPALREGGYLPRLVDPGDFFEQLVRVEPSTEEVLDRVRQLGCRVVQREESYAVVRVNLRQLGLLQAAGIQARRIEEGELVARSVEIAVPDEASMALVVSAGVDVFEVRDGILLGAAHDEQIEALRRQGLKVKVLARPEPPPNEKGAKRSSQGGSR